MGVVALADSLRRLTLLPMNNDESTNWLVYAGILQDSAVFAELDFKANSVTDLLRQVQGLTVDQWVSKFPKEFRNLIRSESDIVIRSYESFEERDVKLAALEASEAAKSAPPPPPPPLLKLKGKKRR